MSKLPEQQSKARPVGRRGRAPVAKSGAINGRGAIPFFMAPPPQPASCVQDEPFVNVPAEMESMTPMAVPPRARKSSLHPVNSSRMAGKSALQLATPGGFNGARSSDAYVNDNSEAHVLSSNATALPQSDAMTPAMTTPLTSNTNYDTSPDGNYYESPGVLIAIGTGVCGGAATASPARPARPIGLGVRMTAATDAGRVPSAGASMPRTSGTPTPHWRPGQKRFLEDGDEHQGPAHKRARRDGVVVSANAALCPVFSPTPMSTSDEAGGDRQMSDAGGQPAVDIQDVRDGSLQP